MAPGSRRSRVGCFNLTFIHPALATSTLGGQRSKPVKVASAGSAGLWYFSQRVGGSDGPGGTHADGRA